jgi:hypothetical protein
MSALPPKADIDRWRCIDDVGRYARLDVPDVTLSMLERVLRCLKPTLVARRLENLLRGRRDFTWGSIPAVSAAVNAQRPGRELER